MKQALFDVFVDGRRYGEIEASDERDALEGANKGWIFNKYGVPEWAPKGSRVTVKRRTRGKRKSRDAYRRVALHCPKCGRSNFLTGKGLSGHRAKCGGSRSHKPSSRARSTRRGAGKSGRGGSRGKETFYVHILSGPSKGKVLGPVRGEYARLTMMLRYGPKEYDMPSNLVTIYRQLLKGGDWRLEETGSKARPAKRASRGGKRGEEMRRRGAALREMYGE